MPARAASARRPVAAPRRASAAPGRAPAGRDAGTVSALERGLALLHCFEPAGGTLGNAELARMTGIPKSTVTRLARTLVGLGYLAPAAEPDRFRLGAGVLRLARVFLDGVDVRALARPRMAELADATGATTLLAVPDGADMVVIEACRARASLVLLRLDVGARVGMAESALGRAHLAALAGDRRDAALRALRGEPRSEGRAGGARDRVAAAAARLAQARADGYALSLGDVHPDVNSVAVALRGPSGEPLALNCGGPATAFPEARLRREIAPRLAEAARMIADDIGGGLPTPDPE